MSDLPAAGNLNASKQRFVYCARQGILKHAIAAEHGGYGDDFSALIAAHEALGKSTLDSGLLLSLNAHLWGAIFPLLNYGNESQQLAYLGKLLSAELIAGHAITEPQAGSDINALTTTAEYTADGVLLNGHKRFITNTPMADLMVIYARLDKQLSAFIVHTDDPGVRFLRGPEVSGSKTAQMGDILLEKCLLPQCRQLGKSGRGKMMIQQVLELERAFIFAGLCGVMDWQLQTVIQYSRQRRVNNKPLGKNQAISHKIAEMQVRLDSIRLWIKECARLKDSRQRITLASAQTKLFASEAFLQSSLDAAHILGAQGLQENSLMSSLVNDALSSRLFSGSSEIQKNIIASLLGTGEGYL